MNIAYIWYMDYGDKIHDPRTTRNVLLPEFIAFAKVNANRKEREFIDKCVEFQKSLIKDA